MTSSAWAAAFLWFGVFDSKEFELQEFDGENNRQDL